MDQKTKLVWRIKFLLIGLIIITAPAAAQDITYTPLLLLSGEYNDNIFFANTDQKDDFIFNVAPGLDVQWYTEKLELDAVAAISFKNYVSESDQDRNDQYYNIIGAYQFTERLQFKGRFYYLKDATVESRVSDLDDTGLDEPDSVATGIESFFSERKQYNGLAAFQYDLTELTEMEVGYRYLKTDYDFEGNSDYEINRGEMKILRSLEGLKDQVGAKLSYDRGVTDSSDNDNYRLSLIWNHIFTETMRLHTELGGRYTETTTKSTGKRDNTWGGVANIRLIRRGETNMTQLGFRQKLGISSDGFPVNESRLDWKFQQELSERLLFKLKGTFYVTQEDGDSPSDEDTVYFDIIPSLNYLLTENHSISLAYGYTIEYDRAVDEDQDTQRNRVWLVYEFAFPQKW